MILKIAALVPFTLIVIGGLLNTRIYKRLRTEHPETYNRLGKPSLFPSNTNLDNKLYNSYIKKGTYKLLGDQRLNKLVKGMTIYMFVCAVSMLVAPLSLLLFYYLGML